MNTFRRKKLLFGVLIVVTVLFVGLGVMQLEVDRVAPPVVRNSNVVAFDVNAVAWQFEEFISHRLVWESETSDFYFFEKFPSDGIGAFRDIPDTRDDVCKTREYRVPKKAKVSIVVVFRNEERSTLLRTIVSVIARTPHRFLEEIILIDDFSADESASADMGQLPLGAFIKLHRNRRHYGLIESRNLGAGIATGDYIVFLDSHSEVNVGWLEPLLDRVASGHRIAVSPVLDSIDATTFQYRASSKNLKGGFDWNLHFRWIPMADAEREAKTHPSDPFTSPAFAGGVFLISRNWFFKLNGFNTLLEGWGGESIEMSIKLWLCGGQIEIVPCSRVGHVFQKDRESLGLPNGQYLRNRKIIAESWLDEYKYFFYSSRPTEAGREHGTSIAGVSSHNGEPSQVERMKKDLQCRPFAWYRETVFSELKLPNEDYIAFGKLSSGQKCLKIVSTAPGTVDVLLKNCYHGDVTRWFLDAKDGRLRSDTGACLDVREAAVVVQYCKSSAWSKSQSWTRLGGKLIHDNTRLCLDNPLTALVFRVQLLEGVIITVGGVVKGLNLRTGLEFMNSVCGRIGNNLPRDRGGWAISKPTTVGYGMR